MHTIVVSSGNIDPLITNMGAQLPSDMYMSAYDGPDSYEKKMAPSAFGYDLYQFTTVCIIICQCYIPTATTDL